MAKSSKEYAWHIQQEFANQTLASMRRNYRLTDLTIVCGDKEFQVHRLHMCTSVPFFAAMFDSKMKESHTGKVNLKSVDADAMKVILDFVYNGTVSDISDESKKLFYNILHASHMLQVEPLFDYYMEKLYSSVTHTKFLEGIELAELYNRQDILRDIYRFLADDLIRITSQREFDDLRLSHLKQILCQSELKKGWTDGIVKGILKWVWFNEVDRVGALEDLIALVQLDKLSTECLDALLNEERLAKGCSSVFNALVSLKFSKMNTPEPDRRMLSFGVITKLGTTTSYMSEFSLATMQWGKSVQIPFKIEFGLSVAGDGGDVYLIGGGSGASDYIPLQSVYKYTFATNSVSFHSSLPVPVNQAGATVLHGHLYVVGGRGILDGKQIVMKKVQRVNIVTGRSKLLASTKAVHNVPNVLPSRNSLYVVGSGSGKNVNVEEYDCCTDCWTIITRLPGDIKWCRATLTANKLFITRKWAEKKFHIFDFENNTWEVRNFVGGPTMSNGLWGVSGSQAILVREVKTNTLHVYDSQLAKWGKKSIKSNHPWFWTLTVIV